MHNLLTQSVQPAILGRCVSCVVGKRTAAYCRLVRGHDEEVATACSECVENECVENVGLSTNIMVQMDGKQF